MKNITTDQFFRFVLHFLNFWHFYNGFEKLSPVLHQMFTKGLERKMTYAHLYAISFAIKSTILFALSFEINYSFLV